MRRIVAMMFLLLGVSVPCTVHSQELLRGIVYERTTDGQDHPVAGAALYWRGTGIGTTTDSSPEAR